MEKKLKSEIQLIQMWTKKNFNEKYFDNSYQKKINIEPEIIKNYLEVLDKHKELLKSCLY